jgi:hypothetical protein
MKPLSTLPESREILVNGIKLYVTFQCTEDDIEILDIDTIEECTTFTIIDAGITMRDIQETIAEKTN